MTILRHKLRNTAASRHASAGIIGRTLRALLTALSLAAMPALAQAADAPASIKVGYVDLVNAQILAKVLQLTEKSVKVPVQWIKFGSGGDLNRAVATAVALPEDIYLSSKVLERQGLPAPAAGSKVRVGVEKGRLGKGFMATSLEILH